MRDRGFILYPGKLTKLETFRVGCIGAIGPEEMRQAVHAVRDTLADMGIRQVRAAVHPRCGVARQPAGATSGGCLSASQREELRRVGADGAVPHQRVERRRDSRRR